MIFLILILSLIIGTYGDHLSDPYYLPPDLIKKYELASSTESF